MIQLCLSYSSDKPKFQTPSRPVQTDLELRLIGTVARHKVLFLTDTGAAFSLLTSFKALSNLQKWPQKGSQASLFIPK